MSNQGKSGFQVGERSDTMRSLILIAAKAQESLDKSAGTVSNGLMVLARSFQDKNHVKATIDGERNTEASVAFVSACELEENFIRSKEAGKAQCDKLPRCWTQAKSNIKAAIEYGIDLGAYTSEAALRKDVIKARGMKDADPIKSRMKDLTKLLDTLPRDEALDILEQIASQVLDIVRAQATVKAVEGDLTPAALEKAINSKAA